MSSAAALLRWYDEHRRDLPWRRTDDPYRIWVSEVMLQQTRVETVLRYYERFLDRFPDVEALASADVEEVLALWSGLGYYRRARQMHSAAQEVVARGGGFPRSVAGLSELPGIGAYTAAAVASIAFGIAEPVLDGNVERVVARRLAEGGDPKARPVRQRLLGAARDLLAPGRPGDSNQALMELGATLCTPREPRCNACPLEDGCASGPAGEAERYPGRGAKRRTVRVRRVVAVVREEGRVLLFRRPDDRELLAGIWELPYYELGGEEGIGSPEGAVRLAAGYGGSWALGRHLGRVRHGITFRALELEVVEASLEGGCGVRDGLEAGWFDRRERVALPLSSMVEKVLRVVEGAGVEAISGKGGSRSAPGNRRSRRRG